MTVQTLTRPVEAAAPATSPDPSTSDRRTVYPLGWLRGIAALLVVVFHAYQHDRDPATGVWPLGGTSNQLLIGTDMLVDMFFVLSGLVLWLPVAQALARGGAARSGRMMLYRRMARLLPLYVLIVCVVWALSNPSLPGHWQDLVLHLTFTHSYSNTYIFWTDGPAWSLAVEFHFYLLMALAVPLVFRAARRASTPGRRLAIGAVPAALFVLVGVCFMVWATVLTHQSNDDYALWFGPLSRGADFGAGMLLALLAAGGVRLGSRVRGALAAVGLVSTLVLVLVRPYDTSGEWFHTLYAATITLGLASIALHDGPWPRILDWRPLSWIGGLGYGIYLLHEPVMRFLDYLGALPAPRHGLLFLVTAVLVGVPSVALAWISSRTIEPLGQHVLAAWTREGSPRDYYAEPSANRSYSPRQRGATSRATVSSTSSEPA